MDRTGLDDVFLGKAMTRVGQQLTDGTYLGKMLGLSDGPMWPFRSSFCRDEGGNHAMNTELLPSMP